MTLTSILGMFAFFAVTFTANGTVFGSKTIEIDFTKSDATNQCEWLPTQQFTITKDGLGWGSDPARKEIGIEEFQKYPIKRGEILVDPVAVGFFWRPTQSVSIRAELSPGPQLLTISDGENASRSPGKMFARFSPDHLHWSSWQALSLVSRTNRVFEGMLEIPGRDQAAYEKLRGEYADRDDIRWSSDEEAAVSWIVERDPTFFENNLPFIGYVQLLFEGDFVTGYRFESLKAKLSYSVGGLHQKPEDDNLKKQMWTVPWRFKAHIPHVETSD